MVNKQTFLNAVTKDIEMVRGDTLVFNFQIEGLDGGEPSFIFTCNDNPSGDTYFTSDSTDGIEQVDYDEDTDTTTYAVTIIPSKTINMDLARYYYDLRMTLDEDVITLLRGRLTLLYEVKEG